MRHGKHAKPQRRGCVLDCAIEKNNRESANVTAVAGCGCERFSLP
jgi:hypothetical protein